MRLLRLIGIAEQIVASRLSSIDLSHKAGLGLLFHNEAKSPNGRWHYRANLA